jgi:transcriptional regulator of acetoin/glycerol metabolism
LADRKIDKTDRREPRLWEETMPVHSTARHAARIQAAIASNGAAKSALIASWRRSSSLHGLDPAGRKPPERLTDCELRKAAIKNCAVSARRHFDS